MEKKKSYCTSTLLESLVTFFFLLHCSPCFLFFLSLNVSRVPLKWLWNLWQLKSLILLCLFFKGRLFCTHRTTGTTQVACVQDFGGSKSIVGFTLCSHSCSSLELPPDHTRRITWNSRGSVERRRSLPVIKYLLFARSFLCFSERHQETWINR